MRNFRKGKTRRELAHVRGSILRKSTGQSPAADFALLMMARGGRDLAANSCKAAAGEDIPKFLYVHNSRFRFIFQKAVYSALILKNRNSYGYL